MIPKKKETTSTTKRWNDWDLSDTFEKGKQTGIKEATSGEYCVKLIEQGKLQAEKEIMDKWGIQLAEHYQKGKSEQAQADIENEIHYILKKQNCKHFDIMFCKKCEKLNENVKQRLEYLKALLKNSEAKEK